MEPEAGVSLCRECFQHYADEEIDIWLMVAVDAAVIAVESEDSIFWDVELVEMFTDMKVTDADIIKHIGRTRNASDITDL
jgi:hypothetical protein